MSAAVNIALKDLRQRLRDRSAWLIGLVVPLGLALILKLTIGQAASGDLTFSFALLDLDRGPVSEGFRRNVLGPLEKDGLLTPTRDVASAEEARRLARRGAVDAALVFPAGFSDAISAGRPSSIQVIANVDAPIGTQVAVALAKSYAKRVHAVQLATATAAMLAGQGGPDPAALAGRAAAVSPPAVVQDASASRRELDFATFYAAGMSVFFLFFTVQFGTSSLVDERRDATLLRLLASPIPRVSVLGGKAITSLVLGTASMATLVAASTLLLGARWGEPAAVALLVGAGVLAATGITAATATFARTAEQAGSFQAIVAVVMGMVGGSFFPVAQAGGVLSVLSRATPHFWFLRGLSEGQVSAAAALPAAAALLALAAVAGAVAASRWKTLVRP